MNRIIDATKHGRKLLSIYFTAGYPELDDTVKILQQLEKSGVDMVEIGLPFSDPLADGPTIQASSTHALKNGMTSELLFEQLKNIRERVSVPLIVMGYFNPMYQYGMEAFCKRCHEVGIDGLIVPDLPLEVYQEHYQSILEQYNLLNIFLITPQTSAERIRQIDAVSKGFIYMVSSTSVTGSQGGFSREQTDYFKRIANMELKNPLMVGFGIYDQQSFEQATEYTHGAIIGSAFINHLTNFGKTDIQHFIQGLRKVE